MAAKSKKSKSKSGSGKSAKKSGSKSKEGRSHKKSREKISNARVAVAVIILAALVLLLVFYDDIAPSDKKGGNIVAEVNGERITETELNAMYNRVPEIYKASGLTKSRFLEESLIPQKLLLQKADDMGITATEAEVQASIDSTLQAAGLDMEGLKSQLEQNNITLEEFRSITRDQLIMNKVVNQSISEIEITEEEIEDFYESNKQLFATGNGTYASLDEVRGRVRDYLANEKLMSSLSQNADIQIYYNESGNSQDALNLNTGNSGVTGSATGGSSGSSFKTSSSDICYEGGKPVVALFSTETCPHCQWIKDTFDEVASEYSQEGKIAAYHWQMDRKDNTLTPEKESSIPKDHMEMFWSHSPQGGVPAFVFGCKYYRIGNAYERSDNLEAEEKEFRAVIDKLLAEA